MLLHFQRSRRVLEFAHFACFFWCDATRKLLGSVDKVLDVDSTKDEIKILAKVQIWDTNDDGDFHN
jgi:hypothetical protein